MATLIRHFNRLFLYHNTKDFTTSFRFILLRSFQIIVWAVHDLFKIQIAVTDTYILILCDFFILKDIYSFIYLFIY